MKKEPIRRQPKVFTEADQGQEFRVEEDNGLLNFFCIKRLLVMCQIYDKDCLDRALASFSSNKGETTDDFLEELILAVNKSIGVSIGCEIRAMRYLFSSKLALVPLIFGIRDSNKSRVALELAYYLNIPNVVLTSTVSCTLRIYKSKDDPSIIPRLPESQKSNSNISEYLKESKQVSLALRTDIEKAIKQGKSVIICGHDLFIPHIFDLHQEDLFPKPRFFSEKALHPLYFLQGCNLKSADLLFIPVALKVSPPNTNSVSNLEQDKASLENQILSLTLRNSQNWPIHLVHHYPQNPQQTSKNIHKIILQSMQELFSSHPHA